MPSLTLKRLRAIEEALTARLAGDLGDSDIPRKVYDQAHDWAFDEIEKRKAKLRQEQGGKTGKGG